MKTNIPILHTFAQRPEKYRNQLNDRERERERERERGDSWVQKVQKQVEFVFQFFEIPVINRLSTV